MVHDLGYQIVLTLSVVYLAVPLVAAAITLIWRTFQYDGTNHPSYQNYD